MSQDINRSWLGLSTGMLATAVFALASCSHKLAPEGHYQDSPVVADGHADDWKLPLRFSNESYTLQYNVTNDDSNVYVCVLSNDDATQMRMLRAGMVLYFDPAGEKNRNISIVFPMKKQADAGAGNSGSGNGRGGYNNGGNGYNGGGGDGSNGGYGNGYNSGGGYRNRNGNPINGTGTDLNTRKEQLLLGSNYYSTTGFQHLENGQFALTDNNAGIRVAMKLNHSDSVLVYEAIVPIRDILGTDMAAASKGKKAARNFSVGIILNPMTVRTGGGNGGSRPSFGGMNRGMMGGMRGGMGGGRGGYGGGQGTTTIREEANWYQFRLVSTAAKGS